MDPCKTNGLCNDPNFEELDTALEKNCSFELLQKNRTNIRKTFQHSVLLSVLQFAITPWSVHLA